MAAKCFVFIATSQAITIPEHLKTCVSISSENTAALIDRLSKQGAVHLYIDGVFTIQGFLAGNLIDEITIMIIPMSIGSGRRLFGALKQDIDLQLVAMKSLSGGFVQMCYRVSR